MSTQTMTHNIECFCADDYLVTPIESCLEIGQVDVEDINFQASPDTTQEHPIGNKATSKKGNERIRFQDYLSRLLDILVPRRRIETYRQHADQASPSLVIYKSNGCSVQPMIWNPESGYDKNGK
jgi:hypothetical protein